MIKNFFSKKGKVSVLNRESDDTTFFHNLNETIFSLKGALNSSGENSLISKINKENDSLKSLVDSYQKKWGGENLEFSNLKKTLEGNLSHNLKHIEENDLSLKEKNLLLRESRLNESLELLEKDKLILDLKESAINSIMISSKSGTSFKQLQILDQKIDELNSQSLGLKKTKEMLDLRDEKIKSKELKVFEKIDIASREFSKINAKSSKMKYDLMELEGEVFALKEEKASLDLIIKERSKLIRDLDLQYKETNLSCKSMQEKLSNERNILLNLDEELKTKQKQLDLEQSEFENRQKEMLNKVDSLISKSKSEIEIYKKKVSFDLEQKSKSLLEKEKDYSLKETILTKIEKDLRNRELRLESNLDDLTIKTDKLLEKEKLLDDKLVKLNKKEVDLSSKEVEVSELKKYLDKREGQIAEKENKVDGNLNYLNNVKILADFENLLKLAIKEISISLNSNNVPAAKISYNKLYSSYNLLPKDAKGAYKTVLLSLFEDIEHK